MRWNIASLFAMLEISARITITLQMSFSAGVLPKTLADIIGKNGVSP